MINIMSDKNFEDYTFYNYYYYGQRLFVYGIDNFTGQTAKFISSKGFDQILIKSDDGIPYNFTKKYMNPYLCSRERDIFKESTITAAHPGRTIEDIGPSNFNGNYKVIKEGITYKDNFYFETKKFSVEGFDLFKYQNDDLYFIQNQSENRNKLPSLINIFDAGLYEKIQIIHCVNDLGDDYFDLNCLVRICDAELGYPDKNSFYNIIRAAGFNGVFSTHKIGGLEFIKYSDIVKFKQDCGNAYIQKNINKKISKRKYAFRYLYEYFQIIEPLVSVRRKQSISPQIGPKEFKKEEFIPIFFDQSLYQFKLIYFKDIFTIERKKEILKSVPGDAIFYIDGYYNFDTGSVSFYNFNSITEITKKIKSKFGVTTSIRFAKCISEWFPLTFGYNPYIVNIKTSQKANSSPLTDKLRLYTIPIKENGSEEIFGADTYVNLYDYLANFGVHIPQIRNILNANRFSSKIFDILDSTFPVFNICRDIRRNVHEFNEIVDEDTELVNLMISVTSIQNDSILRFLEKSGNNKNSYWYSNLNKFLSSVPPGDTFNSIYSPPELQEYLNS